MGASGASCCGRGGREAGGHQRRGRRVPLRRGSAAVARCARCRARRGRTHPLVRREPLSGARRRRGPSLHHRACVARRKVGRIWARGSARARPGARRVVARPQGSVRAAGGRRGLARSRLWPRRATRLAVDRHRTRAGLSRRFRADLARGCDRLDSPGRGLASLRTVPLACRSRRPLRPAVAGAARSRRDPRERLRRRRAGRGGRRGSRRARRVGRRGLRRDGLHGQSVGYRRTGAHWSAFAAQRAGRMPPIRSPPRRPRHR